MKNFFINVTKQAASILMLVLLLTGSYAPLIAQAQTSVSTFNNVLPPSSGLSTTNTTANVAAGTAAPVGSLNTTGNPLTPTTVAAGTTVNTGASQVPSSNCALSSNGSLLSGGDWAQCITDVVYVFTVGIGSGFAYVAAYFFDWAISLSLNGTAYALTFVSQGWTTARDLGNMAFLFILLYIAFKIIFEADTSSTVHMLTWVIVIALLVNFSFFFTRLVIDAGNILSIQFYNAIQAPSLASTAQGNGVQSGVISTLQAVGNATTGANIAGQSKDLTASIMGMLNLQGLLGNDSFQAYRQSANYNFLSALISLSFLYISAGIMLWLLTVAFVTNGVKFLMRIVVLWFLIIASPLAFVAKAIPKFENYYDQWQSLLIKHAFFPAAFMFIFLILTNFANQMSGQNSLLSGLFSGLAQQNNNGFIASLAIAIANVGIRMGFVIAILYIGLKASDQIGTMGADAAKSAGTWAGSKLIGTTGFAGRYSAGILGNMTARNAWVRERAAEGGMLGRTLWRGADKLGKASFDVRSAPGLKSFGGKDVFGEASGKGGYSAAVDARVKSRTAEADALGATKGEKARAKEKAEEEFRAQMQQAEQLQQTNTLVQQQAAQGLQQATQSSQTATQAMTQATQREQNAGQTLQGATQQVQNLQAQGFQPNSPQLRAALLAQQTAQATHQTAQTAQQAATIAHQTAQQNLTAAQQAHSNAQADLQSAQTQLAAVLTNRTERENSLSGSKAPETYGASLTSRSWRNIWQAPKAFIITRANREASAKIRAGKTDNDRLLDAIRGIQAGGGTH